MRAQILQTRSETEEAVAATKQQPSAFARLRARRRAQSMESELMAVDEGDEAVVVSGDELDGISEAGSAVSGRGTPSQLSVDTTPDTRKTPRPSSAKKGVPNFITVTAKRLAMKKLSEAGYGPQILQLGPGDSFGESTLEADKRVACAMPHEGSAPKPTGMMPTATRHMHATRGATSRCAAWHRASQWAATPTVMASFVRSWPHCEH